MHLAERIVTALTGLFGSDAVNRAPYQMTLANSASTDENWPALYTLLRTLARNTRAYQELAATGLKDSIGLEGIRGLRNPTSAVTEFYSNTVSPGSLSDMPLVGDNLARIEAPIRERVWQWSNWQARKQVYVRGAGLLGEAWLKVATRNDGDGKPIRAFLQLIQPDYITVTDDDTDERGFLTHVRVDVPRIVRAEREAKTVIYTEIWSKADQTAYYYATPLDRFQQGELTPERQAPFETIGIDFVPFVQAKQRDTGDVRGTPATIDALDKIIELDRMASSLHSRLYRFNQADWVLEGPPTAADGTIIPPPAIVDSTADAVDFGGEKILTVPGGWRLSTAIPTVNYDAQLKTIADHWEALKETDLPELRYFSANDNREMSGRAIHYNMRAAISRALEARGNLEAALVRATQMALTIGAAHHLWGQDIGTFDAGDYQFGFAERDVIEGTVEDDMDLRKTRADTVRTLTDSGASIDAAARVAGFSEDEATALARVDLNAVEQ